MFVLKKYLSNLLILLKDKLDKELLYVGLQGSYLRNEADDNSDIDFQLIFSHERTI